MATVERTESNQLERSLTAIDIACLDSMLDDWKVQAMARGLMTGYHRRYSGSWTCPVEAVESQFCVPIYNLSAKKRVSVSRSFQVAGVIDVTFAEDNNRWLMDHKTTSSDVSPDAVFWQQLIIEGQISLYLLAEHYNGRKVAGMVWDAIHKPGIRPKKLTKADQATVTSLGDYFGRQVSEQTKQHAIDEGTENSELFEARVVAYCNDHPDYFQRRTVHRLAHELDEYASELWDQTKEVLHATQTNRHTRHSGACMAYNRPCQYLGICSGYDDPESRNWILRPQVHEELDLPGDGRNILTHSRLKCFQTCRRKHYYRYKLGIQRVNHQTSEALQFGTIMHKGLEAWWSHFLPQTPTKEVTDGHTSTASN